MFVFSDPLVSLKRGFPKYDFLRLIDWDGSLSSLSMDGAVFYVYSKLNQVVDVCVPSYTVRKSSFPSWFSFELISLIRRKRAAHS